MALKSINHKPISTFLEKTKNFWEIKMVCGSPISFEELQMLYRVILAFCVFVAITFFCLMVDAVYSEKHPRNFICICPHCEKAARYKM